MMTGRMLSRYTKTSFNHEILEICHQLLRNAQGARVMVERECEPYSRAAWLPRCAGAWRAC